MPATSITPVRRPIRLLLILLVVLLPSLLRAQGENNNWYFGTNNGLSFNSGTPVPLTTACRPRRAMPR